MPDQTLIMGQPNNQICRGKTATYPYLLDELGKELEHRRHRFVRYADDCNIHVGSRHAGERVMASISGFLEKCLKLTVNEQKSAVDRPWNRRILGFTFTRGKQYRRKVSDKALDALKAKIRRFTQRTRGYSLEQIIRQPRPALLGWQRFAPATSARRGGQSVLRRRRNRLAAAGPG